MSYIVFAKMGGRTKKFPFFEKDKATSFMNDLPTYGYHSISIKENLPIKSQVNVLK